MASLSKHRNGLFLIQFTDRDGNRRTVRLPKMAKRMADAVKLKIENLVAASITGHSVDDETSRWVAGLDGPMLDKLAAVGLVPKSEATALGEFIDGYIAGRSDVKESTATVLGHTRRNLIDHFGADKPIRSITEADADAWRVFLKTCEKLGDNTIRRRSGIAKQYFRAAMRAGLIRSNPFDHLTSAVVSNKTRYHFVSTADAESVIEACPDAEWRLLFALARWGGLRTPSESLSLRWAHIDWERERITVPSPKTSNHVGGESRQIPMFPELRPLLEDVFELAEPGAEFVITRYRSKGVNLRTQLGKIIRRAGLTPWPKLWQNLRSSRETELVETYPIHVVCAWIGNTESVAAKHYLQLHDEHFDRATGALQNALRTVQESGRTDANVEDTECEKTPVNTGRNDDIRVGAKSVEKGSSGRYWTRTSDLLDVEERNGICVSR